MKDFRDLVVWRKAHCLTLAIYAITTKFPREEIYGLTSQMRRRSARLPRISPKDVGSAAMASSIVS
jgi:23S rRNA-intervening sequence protein